MGDIIEFFLKEFSAYAPAENILVFQKNNNRIKLSFSELLKKNIEKISTLENLEKEEKYDIVVGDFFDYTKESFDIQSKLLSSMKTNGTGIFILPPIGFGSVKGKKIEEYLNDNNYYVNAYFNFPNNIHCYKVNFSWFVKTIVLGSICIFYDNFYFYLFFYLLGH